MATRNEKLDLVAFMGALCLFFSTIEYLFPKPLPFFRLGLANLPILICFDIFPTSYVLLVVVLKVLGQALVNGTLASYVFLFSAAGSFAAAFAMIFLYNVGGKRVSLIGVGVFGAIASNIVQVVLSVTFIFGRTAWVIAPVFMTLGTGSGLFVGIFAEEFKRRSQWLRRIRDYYA